jgi:hypothetical protein
VIRAWGSEQGFYKSLIQLSPQAHPPLNTHHAMAPSLSSLCFRARKRGDLPVSKQRHWGYEIRGNDQGKS